jgi:oligopeptide/dipeptide ABC transporter ATP-binding protein
MEKESMQPTSDAAPGPPGVLLSVRDLRTEFRSSRGIVRAVDGVSFDVERGGVSCIVGESGCGKSATGLSIMSLLPPGVGRVAGGEVLFDGRDLTQLSERELTSVRGRAISMVFQDPMVSLNPSRTIGIQITETLRRHFKMSRADARKRAVELLEEVELPRAAAQLDAYPHHLSGGMRQRVLIAIAISCRPQLLIADEPTTALDVTVQAQVLRLLDRLRRERDMAMILITHDMGVVAEVAEEVAVMYAGQIVERGAVDDVFYSPEHPYTEALFGALPEVDGHVDRNGRLAAIPGRPPDLLEPPVGCRFAPRCQHHADGRCGDGPVELREIRDGHWVRSGHPRSEREPAAASTGEHSA